MISEARGLGEEILREIGSKAGFRKEKVINWRKLLQLYNFRPEFTDDPYARLTEVLALKSVDSGVQKVSKKSA